MDKKGMSEAILIGLIVLLASAIVMGYAIGSIAKLIKGNSDVEICRTSVEISAKNILGTQVQMFSSNLKCPSESLTIKDEKKAKETIANSMYDCWYKFGEGRLNFLEEDKGNFCYLCSKINFDESLKNKEINGLGDYLKEKKLFGSEKTYAQFLYTNPDKLDLSLIPKISTDKPLYLVYVVNTDKKQAVPFAGAAVVGCAGGAAIGVWGFGIAAIPGCAIGGVLFGVFEYGVIDPVLNEVTIKPTLILSSGDDKMDVCTGVKSFWDTIISVVNSPLQPMNHTQKQQLQDFTESMNE